MKALSAPIGEKFSEQQLELIRQANPGVEFELIDIYYGTIQIAVAKTDSVNHEGNQAYGEDGNKYESITDEIIQNKIIEAFEAD